MSLKKNLAAAEEGFGDFDSGFGYLNGVAAAPFGDVTRSQGPA